MTSYRSTQKQAKHLVVKLASHGTSRFKNKCSDEVVGITSLATEKKYRSCIKQFLDYLIHENLSTTPEKISSEIAENFLHYKSHTCVQKTIDGYRQSISMVFGFKLNHVASRVATILVPRSYSLEQIENLREYAKPQLNFSIKLAAFCGLRSIELDTIAPINEQREDSRDWLQERFLGVENPVEYTVIGKGGLCRKICLPLSLSMELEQFRLPSVIRKTQREIHYQKYYSILGGQCYAQQFSRLSFRLFSWSTGSHGLRHRYAKNRIIYLQSQEEFLWNFALKIVAQEMGHFSTKNTLTYMR